MSFDFAIFSERVTSHILTHSFKAGEVLFEIGDPADRFFYCQQGCVRMEVFPMKGKPLVFYRAREGDAFAEEHIALSQYTYRGVADEESVIESVERQLVLSDLKSNPEIAQRFVYCLARRNFELRANFERLGIKSAKDRVYQMLTTLNLKAAGALDLSGKLKSYSDDLNITHEAMYRALKKLEDEGKIKREKGRIELVDSDQAPQKSLHLDD